jgi:cysteinyl-tRNA synthetase
MLRLFILMSHYSSPIDFSNEALEAASKGWDRLANAVQLVRHAMRTAPAGSAASGFAAVLEEHKQRFIEAMDDDFNSPVAIGVLHDLTREVNSLINSGEEVGSEILEKIDSVYRELGGDVLGIVPDQIGTEGGEAERLAGVVHLLIEMRNEARQNKNWAQADQIRNHLAELGIVLEDRPDGTIYKLA